MLPIKSDYIGTFKMRFYLSLLFPNYTFKKHEYRLYKDTLTCSINRISEMCIRLYLYSHIGNKYHRTIVIRNNTTN